MSGKVYFSSIQNKNNQLCNANTFGAPLLRNKAFFTLRNSDTIIYVVKFPYFHELVLGLYWKLRNDIYINGKVFYHSNENDQFYFAVTDTYCSVTRFAWPISHVFGKYTPFFYVSNPEK